MRMLMKGVCMLLFLQGQCLNVQESYGRFIRMSILYSEMVRYLVVGSVHIIILGGEHI